MLDLTHLNFSERVAGSTPGIIPKAYHDGKFYKMCNYNASVGFYGYSAQNDVISSRYLTALGIPCLAYDGAFANVMFGGKEHIAYVNWSDDYRGGKRDVSLESYFAAMRVPPDKRTARFLEAYPEYMYFVP